jgi:tRNA (cmo5U34)-methyltransferase
VHHLDTAEKAALIRRVAARLAPGGRFVLADVVIPDDPIDAITPIDEGFDLPGRAEEQLQWMRDAKLTATLRWQHRDLAVMVGDRQER